MNHCRLFIIWIATLLIPCTSMAANTVLSGDFDGSEPLLAGLPGTCPGAGGSELAYQQIGPIRVSITDTYTVMDVYNFVGVDVSANIYRTAFDPNNPGANLVTPFGVDEAEDISLESGVDYVMVVQRWCRDPDVISQSRDGSWAVSFSGAGEVTSDRRVSVPSWTEGNLSAQDPIASTACGNSRYQEIGPIQVSKNGKYYFSDMTSFSAGSPNVDVCVQFYSAPFDPASPSANRIGEPMDFEGTVELEANKNYFIVVQPYFAQDDGDFFFVLGPPSFRISHGMAGNWYQLATDGQGFFMDVYDTINILFVGWYTYDLERPADNVEALMGDPGHRWFTAQGPFIGNIGELVNYWTTGMIFDSPTPPKNDVVPDGTMTVEFFDCYSGLVSYEIPSVNVSGEVSIQRIANDAVPLCESLSIGPGNPGPL